MILQYRGTSFISKVIEWFSWGVYSHTSWTFATLVDGKLAGDTTEWESWTSNGVEHVAVIGKNHEKGTVIDLYDLDRPLTIEEAELGTAFLQLQLKKKYDYRGILGFLLREKTASSKKYFCSELIFDFLLHCGRTILLRVKPYQVSPQMIPMAPSLVYIGSIRAGEELKVRAPWD